MVMYHQRDRRVWALSTWSSWATLCLKHWQRPWVSLVVAFAVFDQFTSPCLSSTHNTSVLTEWICSCFPKLKYDCNEQSRKVNVAPQICTFVSKLKGSEKGVSYHRYPIIWVHFCGFSLVSDYVKITLSYLARQNFCVYLEPYFYSHRKSVLIFYVPLFCIYN